MNIVEPILFQCRQNPPAAALCAPGTALNVISYARLERFIHNIGRRALAARIRPGQIVAIQVKDCIFHAAIALALARMGVATLSVADLNLPAGLRVHSAITDAPAAFGSWANIPLVPADLGWAEGDGKPIEERFVSPGGDAIARIVLRAPLDEPALLAHCRQQLSPLFCPVRFVTVERLPRNQNGKIDRQRLQQLTNRTEIGAAQ
jgi:acyl-coenzyme A synthetase/AMP-(fatty) acid ligase